MMITFPQNVNMVFVKTIILFVLIKRNHDVWNLRLYKKDVIAKAPRTRIKIKMATKENSKKKNKDEVIPTKTNLH